MANVWNRLYEDGLDKMEARFVVEEQPFPFHPDIGDSMHYEPSGEVFLRLYEEGLQRRDKFATRLQEEAQKHPFRPNNSSAFDAECWNRLYQEGMQTKERLVRRRGEPTTESLTFKPKVTPYVVKESSRSIFDRLYEEAKLKQENEVRRKSDSYAAMVQSYGFRPNIVSAAPSRGGAVFEELYQDAAQKRQKFEELARKFEAERAAKLLEARGRASLSQEADLQQTSMPAPTEEWPSGPFVPKINQVPGVNPRYLEQRRNYEPIDQARPVFSDRQPWISPLEAAVTEAAQRERERGQAPPRRSRSADPKSRNNGYDQTEMSAERNGPRIVRQSQQPHRTRVKSDTFMRPTVSSNMRSPSSPNRNSGQYTADSPDHKFRYIPLRAEDGRPMSARSLDREGLYYQPPIQPAPSISGLRSVGAHGPGNLVPAAGEKVARTVDPQTRVVDLT